MLQVTTATATMLQTIYEKVAVLMAIVAGAIDANLGSILLVLAVFVGVLALILWVADMRYKVSGEVVPLTPAQERRFEIDKDNLEEVLEYQMMKALGVQGYENDHPAIAVRKAEENALLDQPVLDPVLDPRD